MSGSMRFGSVCSGIEAASVAWGTLGWRAAWLSEIEPFPCAVLAHHYPDVPNLGDMTTLPDRIRSSEVEAPDVFCGGTPCQAFSVAGLRKSLDDARGNLSLTFCEIADAIDQVRLIQQSHPSIVFWENVPGVLNTKDNAFGCFLGALAGEDDALIPPGGRWTNAGFIDGPQRAVAWRVLDAQYFGVAQRRKRVFVVASARADFDPAAVLFEFEGVRRDIAPSRETGQRIAPCVTSGPPFSRTGNERVAAEAMVAVRMVAFGEYVDDGTASAMKARDYKDATDLVAQPIPGGYSGQDAYTGRLIPHSMSYDMKQHHNPQPSDTVQLTTSNCATVRGDTPLVQPIPLNSMNCFRSPDADPSTGCGIGEPGEAMFTITKTNSHAVAQPIVLMDQGGSVMNVQTDGTTGTLRRETRGHEPVVMQPMSFDTYNQTVSDVSQTIKSPVGGANESIGTVLAPSLTTNNPSRSPQASEVTQQISAVYQTSMAVRRLTPVECERLQGFPDGYTNIPWRKAAESPDGPRYKALGNSWAVPVVRWIGERIARAT